MPWCLSALAVPTMHCSSMGNLQAFCGQFFWKCFTVKVLIFKLFSHIENFKFINSINRVYLIVLAYSCSHTIFHYFLVLRTTIRSLSWSCKRKCQILDQDFISKTKTKTRNIFARTRTRPMPRLLTVLFLVLLAHFTYDCKGQLLSWNKIWDSFTL